MCNICTFFQNTSENEKDCQNTGDQLSKSSSESLLRVHTSESRMAWSRANYVEAVQKKRAKYKRKVPITEEQSEKTSPKKKPPKKKNAHSLIAKQPRHLRRTRQSFLADTGEVSERKDDEDNLEVSGLQGESSGTGSLKMVIKVPKQTDHENSCSKRRTTSPACQVALNKITISNTDGSQMMGGASGQGNTAPRKVSTLKDYRLPGYDGERSQPQEMTSKDISSSANKQVDKNSGGKPPASKKRSLIQDGAAADVSEDGNDNPGPKKRVKMVPERNTEGHINDLRADASSSSGQGPRRDAGLDCVSTEALYTELESRKNIYVCECGLLFEGAPLYFIHRTSHNTSNLLKCRCCNYIAKNWVEFHSHFLCSHC